MDGGALHLSGPALLLGDPGWAKGALPLPLRLPRGSYRVQLSRVRCEDRITAEVIERIAALRLRLVDAPAVRWVHIATVAVDTGAVALMGPLAHAALVTEQKAAAQRYTRRLQGDLVPEPTSTIEAHIQAILAGDLLAPLAVATRPRGPVDLVGCSSGFGEGSYEVFAGLDPAGLPVEVVIDFRVLVEPMEQVIIIPDPASLRPGPVRDAQLAALGIHAVRGGPTEPWLMVDCSALWDQAHLGLPEIRLEDEAGQPIEAPCSMQGGHFHLDLPRKVPARLRLVVPVGLRPL